MSNRVKTWQLNKQPGNSHNTHDEVADLKTPVCILLQPVASDRPRGPVLGCDEHAGGTQDLQLRLVDVAPGEEPVDQRTGLGEDTRVCAFFDANLK